MPNVIYLGSRNHDPIIISDEGFLALKSFVEKYRVCINGCAYSEDNPMVAVNTCLSCLLKKQGYLTYIGPAEVDADGCQHFKFITDQGYVYTSSTRYGDEARQDPYITLVHWQFPVPTFFVPSHGERVTLHPHSWQIYGDLRASVVVIERAYDAKHTAVFLSYKGGEVKVLSKRDDELKDLFRQARDILEESKDESGFYHYAGALSKTLQVEWVYEIISLIAGAVYDVKLRLAQASKPEEGMSQETAS